MQTAMTALIVKMLVSYVTPMVSKITWVDQKVMSFGQKSSALNIFGMANQVDCYCKCHRQYSQRCARGRDGLIVLCARLSA